MEGKHIFKAYHVHNSKNIIRDVFIFVVLRHIWVDNYKCFYVMFHRNRAFLAPAVPPAAPPVY